MLRVPKQWRVFLVRGIAAALVLLIALFLKQYYSLATSDQLAWIIRPTAFLTQCLSGIVFSEEGSYGWVDPDNRYLIAPACAGVNFLIITWCMVSFWGILHWRSLPTLAGWLLVSGVMAFGSTLIANSLRIWASIHLYDADIYGDHLDQQTMHRLIGVSVYYLFLCFNSWLVSRMLEKKGVQTRFGQRASQLWLIPLCWYLIISLGLPLLNKAYQAQPQGFLEHAVLVAGTAVLLTLALMVPVGLRRVLYVWHNR